MGITDAVTRNRGLIFLVLVGIAGPAFVAGAVIASDYHAPSSIGVEVQAEEVYALGAPCLLGVTLRNEGTRSVFLPYGLDLTFPQRAFSFNLHSVLSGSIYELRRPGISDFFSVAEGPRGPDRWDSVELEPAESRRYLVDLSAYDLPITIPSGEYRLEVLVFSGPSSLILKADGPVVSFSEPTAGEIEHINLLMRPAAQEPRRFSRVSSILKVAGDHLGEKVYSPRLERQTSFFKLWAVLTSAKGKRYLLEPLLGDAAKSVAGIESRVLLYELALEDDDVGKAAEISETILSGHPESAWRIAEADSGRGFLWSGRMQIQLAGLECAD